MAKAPIAKTVRASASRPAPAATAATPATAAPAIRMLVGQEGPDLSRVRGQELTIGVDIDAAEAQRLVDADFAEEV